MMFMQCMNECLDIEEKEVGVTLESCSSVYSFHLKSDDIDVFVSVSSEQYMLVKFGNLTKEITARDLYTKLGDMYYANSSEVCSLYLGLSAKGVFDVPLDYFGSSKCENEILEVYKTESGWHPLVRNRDGDYAVFI